MTEPTGTQREVDDDVMRGDADLEHEEQRERFELLSHVSSLLEPVMVVLGFIFLVLLLMDFASLPLILLGENRIPDILQWIWVVFVIDFGLRFTIAPRKGVFLSQNWLGALSLVLPFLRPLRVFRVTRALRGMSLVRLLGGVNRGMRVIRDVTRGRQFAFVAILTLVVVLAGAAGSFFFDRGNSQSPINSLGDALWWSTTLVTTVSSELYVVSTEARVIALFQRIFALSIFGYVTASIASYLIDTGSTTTMEPSANQALEEEIRGVRQELEEVRKLLEARI